MPYYLDTHAWTLSLTRGSSQDRRVPVALMIPIALMLGAAMVITLPALLPIVIGRELWKTSSAQFGAVLRRKWAR